MADGRSDAGDHRWQIGGDARGWGRGEMGPPVPALASTKPRRAGKQARVRRRRGDKERSGARDGYASCHQAIMPKNVHGAKRGRVRHLEDGEVRCDGSCAAVHGLRSTVGGSGTACIERRHGHGRVNRRINIGKTSKTIRQYICTVKSPINQPHLSDTRVLSALCFFCLFPHRE